MAGVIRVGDRTSSNGEVLAGSTTCIFMGRGVARLGDPVSCPKHGDNHISGATAGARDNGREVAQHGDPCECGCTLMSSLPTGGPK
ncbi:PAAR domain-containing protein [Burkholderia vietnamiensis]|uniref:PAAR domain-containing protein n=1 Tax=Burkholderia vietnamiensis TaxID=60552 RepID=UPI0009BDF98C|nr:PAAR domain-containing protein [Burkholderia vietnamiensis]MBR7972976.1 PAAR domain-containing protein [Burkholderia vietnamiensis]TPQ47445.1 PAAR domain-containing protein [Burkholderia ubonensis]HDR9204458.1 PAAR domain-containing protein [Burkholderia vietnamiensis]